MRILKILVYILAIALILSQLVAIVGKVGASESYDYGFIVGKVIVVVVVLMMLKWISKYLDKKNQ